MKNDYSIIILVELIEKMSGDMLEQHLNLAKSNINSRNINNKSNKNSKKIKPDSYVDKAKAVLKVRKDQVKQYTNMLSTGRTT